MKKILSLLFLLTTANSYANFHDAPEGEEVKYVGPRTAEVILVDVREAPPVNSSDPLLATVRNTSEFYLDRVTIKCSVFDSRAYRPFKRIIFKTNTILNTAILRSGRLGIPPGKTVDVGLYTTNDEWRPNGYTYDCRMYGVSGSE